MFVVPAEVALSGSNQAGLLLEELYKSCPLGDFGKYSHLRHAAGRQAYSL